MTDSDLTSEIRTTLEGTTPGPWEWDDNGDLSVPGDVVLWLGLDGDICCIDADRALIAVAPELLARAADRIEALERALTVLKHALTEVAPHIADEAVAEFIAEEGA